VFDATVVGESDAQSEVPPGASTGAADLARA